MRKKAVNLFTRPGQASAGAAELLAGLGPCTRAEVLELLVNNEALLGLVFDQAVSAGLLTFDQASRTWSGTRPPLVRFFPSTFPQTGLKARFR